MNNILQSHEIFKTDFVRAENCYLYDKDGKQYVDFESGIWCTALGHCHPRINNAMIAQIQKVIHLGTRYPHSLAQETAKDILDITGIDDGKCVFLSSGSEAVEFGVQIARRVAEKPLFLTFFNSYLAAYGSAGKKDTDEWELFDWSACEHSAQCDCLDAIPFEKIGGFVLEPGGSGTGFVQFPPKQLVKNIAKRVKQHGGILVANEITTGIGRTGKWFGYQHYDIQPDIVAIGKGIGNGYPISAVAVSRDIAKITESSGFGYAQSHQNDPLGCSIAKEVITVLKDENLIEKGKAVGAFFLEGLKRIERSFDVVKEARGRGLLLALEFYPHAIITATWAYHKLLEKGFLAGYYPNGNILRFDPALTVDKKDIEHLLANIETLLETTD
ncbi:aspartate aminotransferase family protein [Desulfosediminicola flagellatus]|uniref:class-III pyridoxal-phosphate-dependent aminotransferase n=1 Tax=Desulfosediminicola flagellatus TaxID=2569541 RepID=UPI0010ABC033|nr:aspartate aminotransferase family protein [Desulfosediminicola flagellatus]